MACRVIDGSSICLMDIRLCSTAISFYCPDHLAKVSADTDIKCYKAFSSNSYQHYMYVVYFEHCMLCTVYRLLFSYYGKYVHALFR